MNQSLNWSMLYYWKDIVKVTKLMILIVNISRSFTYKFMSVLIQIDISHSYSRISVKLLL